MFIIKHRKIWYTIAILLIVASIFSIFYYGLNVGIDFTGGALLEVEYSNARPDITSLQNSVKELGFGNAVVQPTGEKGLLVRLRTLNEEEHEKLLQALSPEMFSVQEEENVGTLNELRFDSIGPTIGKELRDKSWIAILLIVVTIVLYIAFVFRKVSRPVSSFKYGLMAIVALAHDIIIPVGVFAFLGKYGVEIDILFVTAMLTTLGLSVNDTIVVFDRLRENLRKGVGKDFEETVGISVSQTLIRSLNTSLTTIIVLISLVLFGGDSTKYFALALTIGAIAGTYSSIFLASPLLVTLEKWKGRN